MGGGGVRSVTGPLLAAAASPPTPLPGLTDFTCNHPRPAPFGGCPPPHLTEGTRGEGGGGSDALERRKVPPPLSRAPSLCPAAVPLTPSASMAFVTDSNRPQPLWQPPPTACPTASGVAFEVLPF